MLSGGVRGREETDVPCSENTEREMLVVTYDTIYSCINMVISWSADFPPKNLSWAIQPITKATCDKMVRLLPDLVQNLLLAVWNIQVSSKHSFA